VASKEGEGLAKCVTVIIFCEEGGGGRGRGRGRGHDEEEPGNEREEKTYWRRDRVSKRENIASKNTSTHSTHATTRGKSKT